MYKNLVEIGLTKYLDQYFWNKDWVSVSHLQKIDDFVQSQNLEQKNTLHTKFSGIVDNSQITDHFYELMIAYVFHPNASFQNTVPLRPSPDLIDKGIQIEVKNINAPPPEIERNKRSIPDSVSYGPFPNDLEFEKRFTNKFIQRVEKAKIQISHNGIIYIVWDSTLKDWSKRKPQISALLSSLCNVEKLVSPTIEIKCICFEDLISMVSEREE